MAPGSRKARSFGSSVGIGVSFSQEKQRGAEAGSASDHDAF
jgi:hypothetical protein